MGWDIEDVERELRMCEAGRDRLRSDMDACINLLNNEVRRVEDERDRLQERFDAVMGSHALQTRARVDAEGERDRLREALDYAISFMREQGYDFSPPEEVEDDGPGAVALHRQALEGSGE